MLLSRPVMEDTGDEFLLREVGSFLLRGKSRPVRILELLDHRAEAQPHSIDLCNQFQEGLTAARGGRRCRRPVPI